MSTTMKGVPIITMEKIRKPDAEDHGIGPREEEAEDGLRETEGGEADRHSGGRADVERLDQRPLRLAEVPLSGQACDHDRGAGGQPGEDRLDENDDHPDQPHGGQLSRADPADEGRRDDAHHHDEQLLHDRRPSESEYRPVDLNPGIFALHVVYADR